MNREDQRVVGRCEECGELKPLHAFDQCSRCYARIRRQTMPDVAKASREARQRYVEHNRDKVRKTLRLSYYKRKAAKAVGKCWPPPELL